MAVQQLKRDIDWAHKLEGVSPSLAEFGELTTDRQHISIQTCFFVCGCHVTKADDTYGLEIIANYFHAVEEVGTDQLDIVVGCL